MRTSNKLLLGFLMAVFLLPLCTFFVLKGVVKEGKYAVKYYSSDDYYQRGTLTGKYKAIKIIGATGHDLQIADAANHVTATGGLQCTIHYSDSAYYNYYDHNDAYNGVTIKDSISLSVIGDTLVVQRFIIDTSKGASLNYYTSITRMVDLYLPSFQNITVSNAIAQLDSSKTENLTVYLNNNASLILGAGRENTTYSEKPLQYGSSPIVYKNIHIAASGSSIRFNSNTVIDSLYLDMDNVSDLSIPDSVTVRAISGSIDKSTVINAAIGVNKQLIPLVK